MYCKSTQKSFKTVWSCISWSEFSNIVRYWQYFCYILLEQIRTVTVTFVQATFVLGTFVHIRNISAVTDSIWPNFKNSFLGTSRADHNCHSDICPGNIYLGDICQYQEYLNCYWHDLDLTLMARSRQAQSRLKAILRQGQSNLEARLEQSQRGIGKVKEKSRKG